jgi:hypothetical protein
MMAGLAISETLKQDVRNYTMEHGMDQKQKLYVLA